ADEIASDDEVLGIGWINDAQFQSGGGACIQLAESPGPLGFQSQKLGEVPLVGDAHAAVGADAELIGGGGGEIRGCRIGPNESTTVIGLCAVTGGEGVDRSGTDFVVLTARDGRIVRVGPDNIVKAPADGGALGLIVNSMLAAASNRSPL